MHILNIGRGRIQARRIIRRSSRKHGHKGHHHKQATRERGAVGHHKQQAMEGGGWERGTTTAIRKDRGIDESEGEEEGDEQFEETEAV